MLLKNGLWVRTGFLCIFTRRETKGQKSSDGSPGISAPVIGSQNVGSTAAFTSGDEEAVIWGQSQ